MNNSYDTRTWIARKRAEVVEAMAKLEAKLSVYDDLLRDLPADKYEQLVEAVEVTLAKQPVKEKKRRKARRGSADTTMQILAVLEKRGDRGATARDLAAELGIPAGTASGRVSVMKADGLITHDVKTARYFFKGPRPETTVKKQVEPDVMVVHAATTRT